MHIMGDIIFVTINYYSSAIYDWMSCDPHQMTHLYHFR